MVDDADVGVVIILGEEQFLGEEVGPTQGC